MQPQRLDLKNYMLQKPKGGKPPRYAVGVENCIECKKPRGRAYQTHCDQCGQMVCLDCRRDKNGNAFRNVPYICSHCKANQNQFLNAQEQAPTQQLQMMQQAEALFSQNKREAQKLIEDIYESLGDANKQISPIIDPQINSLIKELRFSSPSR